jgi:Tol biopolymer transport system component
MSWARGLARTLTDYVVRATSPDIAAESRRLWVLDLSSGAKCLLSPESGAHEPRWGRGGNIVFLEDADTNADGRIDFNDEQLVRVMSQNGGAARTVARGRSAAWSPDGKQLAIVSQGHVIVVDVQGTPITPGSGAAAGRILVADSRNPSRASKVWAMDARSGRLDLLDAELARKFLWVGALTRDSKRAAFANAQRSALYVGDPATPETAVNVTQDEHLNFDPSWSPDERRLVYVSTNPANDAVCR